MRHVFIVNPIAGKKKNAKEFIESIERTMAGREYEILTTAGKDDTTRFAREAAEKGDECVVYACGGDGTISDVLNGIAGHPNAAMTVIPRGTANDFVKLFEDADFTDIAALADGEERELDLMESKGRYAIDICSVGYDARTARDVGKFKKLPLVSGFGAFTMSALYNLFKGLCDDYRIEADGENLDGTYALICIANARHYGGGYKPIPEANPMDGKLELLLIRKLSRLRVPTLLGKYKNGGWRDLGDLAVRRTVTDVKVSFCGREGVLNMDGEMVPASETEIHLAPIKQRFIAPKGSWDALDAQLKTILSENTSNSAKLRV